LLARVHNIDLTPNDFVSAPETPVDQTPHIPIARWQGVLVIGKEMNLFFDLIESGYSIVRKLI